MPLVFLIGLPGSGKSTVGKRIAKAFKYSFIDLDEYIEKKENCSISDLFALQGEPYFRNAERISLEELVIEKNNILISTGGGTPCFFNNLEIMLNHGVVVYLNPPLKMIVNRLIKGKKKRPAFKGLSLIQTEEKLNELLLQRLKFYSKANISFNQEEESFANLLSQLEKLIQ